MRKNWIVLALGMSVAIVGFAAGEAEAMISSSLAVETLSKAAPYRKQRVSGSDVAGSDSIAFVNGGAAGVGPAYKIRKRPDLAKANSQRRGSFARSWCIAPRTLRSGTADRTRGRPAIWSRSMAHARSIRRGLFSATAPDQHNAHAHGGCRARFHLWSGRRPGGREVGLMALRLF